LGRDFGWNETALLWSGSGHNLFPPNQICRNCWTTGGISTMTGNRVCDVLYVLHRTDTIGFVSNRNPIDTIIVHQQSDYPRPVLKSIVSNLNSLGYSKVSEDEDPDLRVNVYVINDYNLYQQIIYPSYYYPSYYGYGYGYGSLYGFPYVNTYAVNSGSLVIELLDLKNITPDNKVKVIWSAYMGDVYNTADLIKQTEKAIDQAFLQSPYLNRQ
jgi:hypothetical protein